MPPRNEEPTAETVGIVEDREEPLTARSYPDAITDPITDEQWKVAVLAVVSIAGGDSERGERARRAVHALCGQPFVSRPLWTAAQSVAWISRGRVGRRCEPATAGERSHWLDTRARGRVAGDTRAGDTRAGSMSDLAIEIIEAEKVRRVRA